jgi:hypothetical protein
MARVIELVRLGDGRLVRLGQAPRRYVDPGRYVYPDRPDPAWPWPGHGVLGRLVRAPFTVDLTGSGERGATLTAERRLRVLPYPSGEPQPEPVPPVDLTKSWPWLFPPRDNWPIARQSAAVTVAAGATQTIAMIGPGGLSGLLEVPRGHRGAIRKFGNSAADFTAISWSFLVKVRPTDPIVNLAFQYGPLNQPTDLPGAVLLEPGDDFVIQAVNTSAVNVVGVAARAELFLWRI